MIRKAFIMKLKPGALAEYRRYHENVWPQLLDEIKACGIKSMSIYEDDPYLFLCSEVEDEESWDRLWGSEIHDKWGEVMEPLMEFRDDGIVDSKPLNEVFHYRP